MKDHMSVDPLVLRKLYVLNIPDEALKYYREKTGGNVSGECYYYLIQCGTLIRLIYQC